MQTTNNEPGFATTIVAKFRQLAHDNPLETTASAASIVWLATLWHQSALLQSPALPQLLTTNAATLSLVTSLISAMAAAICIHFMLCLANPRPNIETLRSRTSRARFTLAAWWLIAYFAISIGSFVILLVPGLSAPASTAPWHASTVASIAIFTTVTVLAALTVARPWIAIMQATARRRPLTTTG